MKSAKLFGILLLTLFTVTSLHGAELKLSPIAKYVSGETKYVMELLFSNPLPGEPAGVKSELIFPIDGVAAGAALSLESREPYRWKLGLTALINLNDPSEKMTDDDYFYSELSGEFNNHWSSTESDDKHSLVELHLSGETLLLRGEKLAWSAMVDVGYMKSTHEIIGYSGWQIGGGIVQLISGTEPAIDYWVRYITPWAGTSLRATEGSFEAGVALLGGLAFAADEDDHLLRGKIADADGSGFGIETRFTLGYNPKTMPRLSLRGTVASKYIEVDGSQTQRWYEDETIGGQTTPAGTVISSLPHDFRLSTFSVSIAAIFSL
jgi:outer membrane protease